MAEKISNKKKPVQPAEENEMSFWDHLEELRWHLIRSIVAIIVLAVLAFLARDFIFDDVILAPKSDQFITNRLLCQLSDFMGVAALCLDNMNLEIINIRMSGQFLTHMYVSIVTAFIVAFPYITWEIWTFVRPALMPNEKKHSRGAVFVSSLLFAMGVLFSYFLIVPLTIHFLGTYQVSENVANTISLSSYISTVVSVTFAVGIVFELPIVIFFLTKIGIVTPEILKKNRKYMFVILLLLSAIITPPDVFSQILVVIPLMVLYEVSIKVSVRVYNKQQKALAG